MLKPCSRMHFLCASISSVQFSWPFSTMLIKRIPNVLVSGLTIIISIISWLTIDPALVSFRDTRSTPCTWASRQLPQPHLRSWLPAPIPWPRSCPSLIMRNLVIVKVAQQLLQIRITEVFRIDQNALTNKAPFGYCLRPRWMVIVENTNVFNYLIMGSAW